MPSSDSSTVIVARFLKANHYYETLEAFLREAGLPEEAGNTSQGDWTLEKILEEKKQYDSSLAFEKKSDNERKGWTIPAPSSPVEPHLPLLSNVLCVVGDPEDNQLLMTAADRSWNSLTSSPPYSLKKSLSNDHDSPILSIKLVSANLALSTSMSGQLMLHHTPSGKLLGKCRHHLKYAVQVAVEDSPSDCVVATAGWDQKVFIYAPKPPFGQMDVNEETNLTEFFGEPIHTIDLPSNPESLLFVRHPDTSELHLVLSRRDSTHLYYYGIIPKPTQSNPQLQARPAYTILPAGRQNLAPHSNAWVAFTPSCLSPNPKDPTLLAIATSHLPHLKLIIVRLLFPGPDSSSDLLLSSTPAQASTTITTTQASQARAALALQDREDAAITLHVTTLAPQTPYSTPQVVWRPDASGVWVNGDDGVVRGIEVANGSGKVVCLLRGHEAGSKVRTLWAGNLGEERKEVLVSGGFDKRVLVWEV